MYTAQEYERAYFKKATQKFRTDIWTELWLFPEAKDPWRSKNHVLLAFPKFILHVDANVQQPFEFYHSNTLVFDLLLQLASPVPPVALPLLLAICAIWRSLLLVY